MRLGVQSPTVLAMVGASGERGCRRGAGRRVGARIKCPLSTDLEGAVWGGSRGKGHLGR